MEVDVGTPANERLVSDVNDLVMTRLSRLGFDLVAITGMVDGAAEVRMLEAVDVLDTIVRDLRGLLFGVLQVHPGEGSFEATIRSVVEDAGVRLGCRPQFSVVGDLEDLPATIAHHLIAVVMEAVHNTIIHAQATALSLEIVVGPADVDVEISDDGIGPPPTPAHGLGLGSMAARARELGGCFEFTTRRSGGALVRWSVPRQQPGE